MQKIIFLYHKEGVSEMHGLTDANAILRSNPKAKVVSVTPLFETVDSGSSCAHRGEYGAIVVIDYND